MDAASELTGKYSQRVRECRPHSPPRIKSSNLRYESPGDVPPPPSRRTGRVATGGMTSCALTGFTVVGAGRMSALTTTWVARTGSVASAGLAAQLNRFWPNGWVRLKAFDHFFSHLSFKQPLDIAHKTVLIHAH